jgi:hypothetical protein
VRATGAAGIETRGQVSPNGKWVAYQAQEPIRNDIYVQQFGGGPAKYQISTSGGVYPRWRGDGRELFYFDQSGGPAVTGKVMAVEIGASVSSLERGVPTPLFGAQYFNFQHPPGILYHPYAVSRDGQRFLIPRAESDGSEPADGPVAVVLNWAAALRK